MKETPVLALAWQGDDIIVQGEIGDVFFCKDCRKKNGDKLDKLDKLELE